MRQGNDSGEIINVANENDFFRDDSTETLLQSLSNQPFDAFVLAGEGEPTLRLPAILALADFIRGKLSSSNQIPIRVVTNGLTYAIPEYYIGESCVDPILQMKDAGVTSLSVALMTASPSQYDDLMKPVELTRLKNKIQLKWRSNSKEYLQNEAVRAHDLVCEFIHSAVLAGFDVEVTGVDRPDVDKFKAEALALHLGVTKQFRWRPYFPKLN
eukprot:CAMPEP_0194388636 /NCGR_PEP_ID=MMETSP0174-20130528/99639_1 /TAXON_ID=216777 /ORGANISM="Proboscia alata, Strain PI-D3" /LENGTH=212 /DNA_ID=CAMNT_0039180117 /DNA_START=343 /DNA_END=981 /DNA_ORIENTATION=-